MQKKPEVVFRLSVTRQNEPAAVASGKADVDHLDGAEFFQDGQRREIWGISHRAILQRHLLTVSQKSDEDMRIDAISFLVIDRTDAQFYSMSGTPLDLRRCTYSVQITAGSSAVRLERSR